MKGSNRKKKRSKEAFLLKVKQKKKKVKETWLLNKIKKWELKGWDTSKLTKNESNNECKKK